MTLLTAQQMTNQALRALENSLSKAYTEANKPIYQKRCVYGKFRIYKQEWIEGLFCKTCIAKGLTAAEAEGMMKLLKEEE
jgi:hypothetical protein